MVGRALQSHDVDLVRRADGTMLMRARHVLGPVAETTAHWLRDWADRTPDAVFLAERSGAGWRELTYLQALEQVRGVAAALLARGLTAETPIMILSGNSVNHAVLSLAAQYAGVPTVPVAEQYSLIEAAHGRLRDVAQMILPAMIYVEDADAFARATGLDVFADAWIVATHGTTVTPFANLLRGDSSIDAEAANAQVGPDTVAKILLTSGSTSSPKGVLTTQRMLCTNQTQIADALPFLRDRPPRILDWLPWNHVFGGSHNVNMMLANGGSLYIDDGKPTPDRFARSVENLRLVGGSLSFNVPVGYAMLLDVLKDDAQLRTRFFDRLDMVFYSGASLPQNVWNGLQDMARERGGQAPLITSSWGLTETAPACVMQHQPTDRPGIVGVPLSGVTVKLIPDVDMRCEVRVKGPNVMPGYFDDSNRTRAAFDEEGFFITGDAMVFVDPADPNKGMRFDGRILEDFKLITGTWVRAASLRLEVLPHLAPYAADLIVTGADRAEVGVLIMPNRAALADMDLSAENGVLTGSALNTAIGERLRALAEHAAGSSTRIARALVLADPPSMADGEVTAKGNLNINALLKRRAAILARLYDDADSAVIRL